MKTLRPHPLSFDTHTNYPGGDIPLPDSHPVSPGLLLQTSRALSLSFKRAKIISFIFNALRTLCTKCRGVPKLFPHWESRSETSGFWLALHWPQDAGRWSLFKSFVRRLPSAALPPIPPADADPDRPSPGAASSPSPLRLPSAPTPACTESSAAAH